METKPISKKVVASSMTYSVIISLISKALGLIISIVLARILSPNDFGIVAIVMAFVDISQTIITGGFKVALVQKKEVDDLDFSTVFIINLAVSVVMVVVLFFCAPVISQFYHSDLLVKIIQVYSFSLLFVPFSSVLSARLEKKMKFKELMLVNIVSSVISGAVGIVSAYLGLGVWSILLYYALHSLLCCAGMAIVQKWFPKLKFSLEKAKVLFSFGWKMLVSALLTAFYNNIRSIIIGKKYSEADLAYYDRGRQIPYIIATTLDNSIQNVMLPTISSVQEDKAKVKHMLSKTVKVSILLILPAMFGLLVIAEPLVKLLLTDKWLPCVPYLQLIAIAWATMPFSSANLVAIKALGKSNVYLTLEIVRRTIMIGILIISLVCFNSVIAVAIGFAISMWVDVIIIMIPVKRIIGYSLFDMFKDSWKTILSAVVMGGAVLGLSYIKINYIVLLLIQIAVGASIYLLLCKLLKNDVYLNIRLEVINFFKNHFHKKDRKEDK